MQTATKPQIAKIHVLLNNLDIADQKAEMVYNVSNGRTESSKELTIDEARILITFLAEYDPREKLKGLIFSLAYKAGIIYGDTPDDKKMNAAKLIQFIKERGSVKKNLNSMNYSELVKVHRQFEAILKSNQKSSDNKLADKAVKSLMNELNLQTL
ncbi:hypothetical protein [Mucilaginibacter sp.]|uniref:hypothetical protein n=1 Tax=Mucilaginibacter sp. TaxID=1882438 RepID=UPI00262E7045|nr:hypothetical protein [Mucilaginibacter sp.]MDB5029718.1 hypothetical protein [Mucilaginibacter sp.]